MGRKVKVFISYRNIEKSRAMAKRIADELLRHEPGEEPRYDVFWDAYAIKPGRKWRETIYHNLYGSDDLDRDRHIPGTDVLLLLLERDTAESDWVQREVDIARGMHIAILPLVLSADVDQGKVTEELAVDDLQYIPFKGEPHEFDRLCRDLDSLADLTYERQKSLIRKLHLKWDDVPISKRQSRYASYTLRDSDHPLRIHLATGNIVEHRNIDVIVNTENDYMQMARIFETSTVSSVIRFQGAHFDGVVLVDDAIQRELDEQVRRRPVPVGSVYVTSSGHAHSRLRQTGFRYVLHAAAVSSTLDGWNRILTPISAHEVQRCIESCLHKVDDINTTRGIQSPAGSQARALQEQQAETYQPIRSIILPLVGTGLARADVKGVVEAMLAGIDQYVSDAANTTLTDIYISVYRERDLKTVKPLMDRRLQKG